MVSLTAIVRVVIVHADRRDLRGPT